MGEQGKVSNSDRFIKVLNAGYVRLVDSMGNDLSIVRAARVSYNADWREGEVQSDRRLISYLLRNKHTSPFEMVEFTFEIQAPIFVVRQWHRHRTWSYNEVSGRYTELDMGWFVPQLNTVGVQSKDNKQARDWSHESKGDLEQFKKWHAFVTEVELEANKAFERYHRYLEMGIPRELARIGLPLQTYTRFFAKTDLHNLLHFIRLRDHEHAQYEVRVYAQAIRELIKPIVPVTLDEFDKDK